MLRAALVGPARARMAMRSIAVTAVHSAPATPAGKKKVKVGFKKEATEKVRKGGMTHLKFGDAVRALKYEKNAKNATGLQNLTHESLSGSKSQVVSYKPETEQKLNQLNAFKKYQHHELFTKPISLVSENTVALHSSFVQKLANPSSTNRICLLGEKGIGKSTMITQAQALALSEYKENIVLMHFDQPERIVDGTSDYIFNKTLNLYQQPMFTKRFIMKFREANEAVLKRMPLSEDVSFVTRKTKMSLKKDVDTLYDYLAKNYEFGFFGPTQAFQFFVKQLQHHSQQFPVFVSVDNFNALITDPFTKYRHPDMRFIHNTQFEMGKFIQQLVGGDLSFAKGGVLLAECKDFGKCKTMLVGLGKEPANPYDKRFQCDLKYAENMMKNDGIKVFDVQKLLLEEARSLLQFWKDANVLKLRNYPTKDNYSAEENLPLVGTYRATATSSTQLENVLKSTYFVASGNPGLLLKANTMMF